MPPFQVVSEFEPTGDQPQAIQTLVRGINQDMKHQVLLGVTGSGKSLGYDDLVYVVEQRGDGQNRRVLPIGPLVDGTMKQAATQTVDDTEILDLRADSPTLFVQSFDPATGQVGLRPVSEMTRHRPTERMYRLRTACGREATLTGDHNLWVLRGGSLTLVETHDVRAIDAVPLPVRLLAGNGLESLDLVELLRSSRRKLFVQAAEVITSYAAEHGAQSLAKVLADGGISPHNKLYAVKRGLRGQGVQVGLFARMRDETALFGGLSHGKELRITARRPQNGLPAHLVLTQQVLALLGYYIAEGHATARYIVLANRAACVRTDLFEALNNLGLHYNVRKSSDIQVSSVPLAALLDELCGASARDKKLPSFWPDLSDEQLAALLRAYFDGDGTVERERGVSATTASRRLASDLCYALMRFGIWARTRASIKRATNANHSGAIYYTVTISGRDDMHRFAANIGFTVDYKRDRLAALLERPANSNVDVVPIAGSDLRELRTAVGMTERQLAQRAGISRPAISLIESDKRRPQRSTLVSLLAVLEEEGARLQADADWWVLWRKLNGFTSLRWTPVAEVREVDYPHSYVYDFSVPGTETFLAGEGGFFVHNTYTMAKVVEAVQKPTLIIAHNKTLAAQLYSEMREFFPRNAVEYFVSYYDYYQPEAYIPRTDTYIEKDSQINEEIDRLRLAATSSLFARRDVVIVASVSSIYGLGSPQDYGRVVLNLRVGELVRRQQVLRHLVDIYYERNDNFMARGRFRVRGDVLEVQPADRETAYRISLWGDEVERITEIDTVTGEVIADHQTIDIYPAKHFVTPQDRLEVAINDIEAELQEQVKYFESQGKLLEAQRIKQRTLYDIEMLREVGFCNGIENYSRPLAQRPPGSTPWTLLDYFPADWLLIIDESHMTIPQIRGMYNGDRQRKEVLVEYGFRLPSALDNRPLRFDEFEADVNQAIYVSATPGPYEKEHAEQIAEQVIRPTGLIDPEVEVRPTKGQVDDLLREIKIRVAKGQRVLVTTLTKRMAEDLTEYLAELNIKVHYLHSDIHTIERVEILRDLRMGVYDVVVGINLLREGLDLPEVSLVAILDADKEGFLRSENALIQNIGRAARHVEGKAILYADRMTDAMRGAIDETNRRRSIQEAHNRAHNIEPRGIVKSIRDLTDRVKVLAETKASYDAGQEVAPPDPSMLPPDELAKLIKQVEAEMKDAAKALEFERAALLRDQLVELKRVQVEQRVGAD